MECINDFNSHTGNDKTAGTAKNPSIKYMHKILENWYAQGVTSAEDAKNVKNTGGSDSADKSYDLDDFFQQAVYKGRKDL